VALANGNVPEFTTRINERRALNTLPAWTGAEGQPSALAMLQHERHRRGPGPYGLVPLPAAAATGFRCVSTIRATSARSCFAS